MNLFISYRNISPPDFNNPLILASIIIMVISIFLPCIIWFIRNFYRIILNKNIEWLNRSLKWFFLVGVILFIVSIILIILISNGVIT